MRLQVVVSQAWTAMLILGLAMGMSQVFQAAAKQDFSEFAAHPGPKGWGIICVATSVYAMMTVLTLLSSARWFRWLSAGLMILITLYMGAHQLQHMAQGVHYGLYGAIDLAHHAIGAIGSVCAVRWARSAILEPAGA
jgi:hypothetical protein